MKLDNYLKLFYFISNNTREFFYKLKRGIEYFRFSWKLFDFDYTSAFSVFEYQLNRVRKDLNYSSKYVIHEKRDIDALIEAIEIVHRLSEEDYEEKYYLQHEEKWGKLDFSFKNSYLITGRPKAITPEEKEKERQELLDIYKKADSDRKADINRLRDILIEHSQTWWW